MNRNIIIAIVVVLAGIGIFYKMNSNKTAVVATTAATTAADTATPAATGAATTAATTATTAATTAPTAAAAMPSMADVTAMLDPAKFDPVKVTAMIAVAPLDAAVKKTLTDAVAAAGTNMPMIVAVIAQIKTALKM